MAINRLKSRGDKFAKKEIMQSPTAGRSAANTRTERRAAGKQGRGRVLQDEGGATWQSPLAQMKNSDISPIVGKSLQ